MDPDYFVIGLRYLLDIHGLSDRKAAEACGVSQPTLSDILAGRSEGRLKNREKIARGMGRTYAQVLDLGREQMDEALITRYRNPMALKLVQMIGRMDQEGDDEALRRLFRIAEERDEVKALR